MREIKPAHIAFFIALLALIVVLVIASEACLSSLPLGEFRGVLLFVVALLLLYGYALIVYRLFLLLMPLREGVVPHGTRAELVANVNILFYLLLFNSLIRTHFIPVPLLRLIYLALGARLGRNTYSAGVLLDPPLTHIGSNTIIGHDAVIFAHVIEGQRLELKSVHIGDNVTIGATAVVMAGVTIGNGAIVSVGAVVTKDSRIGADEIWGGIPARLLKRKGASAAAA
ncbi:acyltransferase [Janthinobacterium agaricidamnosum]|uniref:Bacterial transferase hexapeptide family protein n=1 Tax=Janthinobacterium agaricidamnosum NBRC 102515 = DSM 9628 TaxID=1349767 RepID=W0V8B7_9BURK|nr:acyltransferase [Janthinobacterium agaricidamnosum]CDG83855.1 bacterial transferase hexapeptide family protein [Janthinobacterium agaricidamnosum NBRC 102515 = DSM 9628]